MINRLFKEGAVTTFVGFIVLGIALYMWVSGKSQHYEFLAVGSFSLVFFGLKDKHVGIKPKETDEDK